MYKFLCFLFGLLFSAAFAFSAGDVAGAVEGTVKKIDADSKTFVVKTADGTEHTFHFADKTTVHGVGDTAKGTRDTLHGLKEGSKVAVHYTDNGATKTAEEIDHIGKDGLKTGEGVLKKMDRGAKTLTVVTAGGVEETYRLSDRAAKDSGKEVEKGANKSEKVTVYYSEEAGHKVAHFFKKIT